MARFIKWTRPRGAVNNLAHALSLADQGANILCVSDATLYVLQNLVALDVTFKSRWSDEVFDFGYKPIADDSVNYDSWVDLIEQIQNEVRDMSCEIVPVLEEMRDEMIASNTKIDALIVELQNLVAESDQKEPLIDDIEPIMDAINIILGGAAILGG
jgi:hypothetical protein